MTDASAPRPKPRRARGLMDRRGPGLAVERELITNIAKVYEEWGFEPLETPAFEYADALGKFLPDQDRPNEGVFAFEDDEEWVALRYDLTAPLARFVAENFDALPKPYTVGSASPAADAEMIAMACAALEAAGVSRDQFQIKFSTRRVLDAVLEKIGVAPEAYATRLVVLRAIDKFDRLGRAGVEGLLGAGRKDESGDFTKGAGLEAKQRAAVLDLVSAGSGTRAETLTRLAEIAGEDAIADLRQIDASLTALGVTDACGQIDPTIVRGLEYYTGAVFEAQLLGANGAGFGSVGGGGRYDDLVARFRGERIPATGFSFGVSRLAAALQAQEEAQSDGPVVVLVMDQARVADALAMADELRRAGVRAEAYLGAAGMKAQLKYADKRVSPIAVIQGGDELAKGVVTLKDLKLGAKIASGLGEDREAYAKAREQVQVEVPRAQLVAAVQQMLAR
jgi:histidyl-tRNA synthetase